MKNLGIVMVVFAALAYFFWPDHGKRHPPGILIPDAPSQTNIRGGTPWEKGGYRITPLAEFQLRARLLSKHRYWLDRESQLSPIDFLLGWGPMSDQKVLDQLSLSQGSRWYEWQASQLPIPQREIEAHCANMHMIPANPDIERQLKQARIGDIVELKGYLISVQAPDGWHWKSSLTRTDTGGSSCELVWVEEFEMEK